MGVLFIILLLIGAYIYFSGMSEPAHIKEAIKGRTIEQQEVIKYFLGKNSFPNQGFLCKRLTDEEYDSIKNNTVNKSNFKQKALDKIGLDISQISEIDPVHFEGWLYGKKNSVDLAKYGKVDHKPRSSAYQITWLFFSSSQVYIYRHSFHFNKDDKRVSTEEYFYKDITNFSTSSDTVETNIWNDKLKKYELKNIDSNDFTITVPGEKFYCSLEQNEYSERAIQGMKAKLREKKG